MRKEDDCVVNGSWITDRFTAQDGVWLACLHVAKAMVAINDNFLFYDA